MFYWFSNTEFQSNQLRLLCCVVSQWNISLLGIWYDYALNSAHLLWHHNSSKERRNTFCRECLIIDFGSSLKFPFDHLKRLFTASTMGSFELSLRTTLLNVETLNYINLRFRRTVLQAYKYLHFRCWEHAITRWVLVIHDSNSLQVYVRMECFATEFQGKWNN